MLATLVQVAKELARYEEKTRGWDQERVILHRLCESAIKGKEVPKVAVIDLAERVVRLEDYKEEERYKYLYALSTGNAAIGPSWLLDFRKTQGKAPKKTREEIIRTGIKKIREALKGLRGSTDPLSDDAWEKLRDKLNETTKGESVVLVTVVQDGEMPGEREELRKGFVRRKIFGEDRAKAKGEGHCAVCGNKGQVSSAIPFFFTVEKQGFSPMGRESDFWKHAPVCDECAKWLCVAESYLEENLSTRVAGKSTYLVPDLEPGASEIEGSFVHFLWEWRERTKGKAVPQDEFPIEEEPNPFEWLVEESDGKFKAPFRSASLVFYQRSGRKFMFLYTISDILPANLRRAKSRLTALRKILRSDVLGDVVSLPKQLRPDKLKADFKFVGRAWRWPRRGRDEAQGTLKLTPMHLVEAILTDQRPPEREFWQDADRLLRATYQETISRSHFKILSKQMRIKARIVNA